MEHILYDRACILAVGGTGGGLVYAFLLMPR